jgi:TatD DNase family protein
MLVDSHCHLDQLDLTPYQGELGLALHAANQQGVERFLCVCINLDHFHQLLTIADAYEAVQTTVGLHPNETVEVEPDAAYLAQLADHPLVVAIGETGLDYYRSSGDIEWQRQRFRHISVRQ